MTNKRALKVLSSWLQLAYHNADGTDEDSAELYEALQTVFALITHQQEEIKKRNTEYKRVCAERDAHRVIAHFTKSETLNEFVERFKQVAGIYQKDSYVIGVDEFDNIYKEMVDDCQ